MKHTGFGEARLTWIRTREGIALSPERYLGELSDLPRHAEPGDWCDLVILDSEGEMRWIVVAVESDAAALSTDDHRWSHQARAKADARDVAAVLASAAAAGWPRAGDGG
jgi:hypothetical protein